MVKDYMDYGFVQSFLAGAKIATTLLPIAALVILTAVLIFWFQSKIGKKK